MDWLDLLAVQGTLNIFLQHHSSKFRLKLKKVGKTIRSFKSESEVAQYYLILCNPMDCNLPGSSVHGILQTRILEWVARSFRYDLNQIPYDYIVEMTNRFKGLDLIDRVPEEPWMEVHDIVQEAVIKTIPKKKRLDLGKLSFSLLKSLYSSFKS